MSWVGRKAHRAENKKARKNEPSVPYKNYGLNVLLNSDIKQQSKSQNAD